jgi:hypothetical protein
VLLQHFWLGLSKESALQLDISTRGSFTHKTTAEGEALLDRIRENTSFTETLPAAESLSHEEVPFVDSTNSPPNPIEPTTEFSNKPETMEEEEIQPPEFPFNIKEDVFQIYRNTSMYPCEKRPPVPRDPVTPPDKASLQEAIKGVTAVMNSEWVHEGEMTIEVIRVQTPLYTLPCFIQGTAISAHYSPMVGANIMSASFALSHLSDNPLLLTSRSFWSGTRSTMEGIGILHNVPIWYDQTELAQDFHIFEVQYFDILIGQPQVETVDEVEAILPVETPESSLENDAEFFTEEKDDQDETFELPTHKQPPHQPIEPKPLPSRLRYAFLNDNSKTPVIISNKLSDKETTKLIAVLEKHRSVFGYSLQDLKGISPTLCTHPIPIDPTKTPSKEPQRRLNNTMREVVKKEVLKLLHAGIIYPVPHSEWVSPVQVVPKKGGMTVVENNKNELIPQRTVTGWRMCIDYQKLNAATKKDHFPLPFIDKMLE